MAKSKKQTPKERLIIRAIKGTGIVLKDKRFRLLMFVATFFFSIFLLLAFSSYFFTWKVDQSCLDLTWRELISNPDIMVDNWAGKTGAFLANKFIHDWFGIPSFAAVFIFGLISFRFIPIRLLPLRKSLRYTLLIVIWTSLLLAFLFGDSLFSLGGSHGYYMCRWLNSFIGKFGTMVLLLISAIGFIFFVFEDSLEKFKSGLRRASEHPRMPEGFSSMVSKYVPQSEPQTVVETPTVSQSEPVYKETIKKEEPIETVKSTIVEPVQTFVKKEEYLLRNDGVKESLGFEIETKKEEQVYQVPLIKVEEDFVIETPQPESTKDESLALAVERREDIETETFPMATYDPTLDLSDYKFPTIDLLEDHKSTSAEVTEEELIGNKNKIVETLNNFKIEIVKIKALVGPTVTLYEIIPAPGVRISKIKSLEDDIALSLSALGIRIIAPMPGRGTIGIEVPNQKPEIVSMRSVLSSAKFQESTFELPIALGKTISNETYVVDLTKMPHLLVAGATGQGKSVGLNAILTSLIYKKHPSELKLVLIDPKKVELTLFEKLDKHFLAKLPDSEEAIITHNQEVIHTLSSLNIEMDKRYGLLKAAQVRNIKEYNTKFIARRLNPNNGHSYLPYIVLVIDEFADLIMTAGKEIELPLARIAQLARAVGIHLIVATQRPSTNIITGVIKANFPTRIAFKVPSMIDSRTILDASGANQLIGRGDMLITQGSDLVRVQCAFIDTPEVERIVNFVSSQRGYPTVFALPDYAFGEDGDGGEGGKDVDMGKKDDLFEEAARLVVAHQQGSTSLIQRKMAIGYNRAGRIMDQLEQAGIVGPSEGSKARQVLIIDDYQLEQYLNNLK